MAKKKSGATPADPTIQGSASEDSATQDAAPEDAVTRDAADAAATDTGVEAAGTGDAGGATIDDATTSDAAQDSTAETPVVENPLHKKLGLRSGSAGLIVAPPEDDDNPLLPLPDGFVVLAEADAVASVESQFDYVHFFAQSRTELTRVFLQLRDRMAPSGVLWISWIKQSSSRRGGGLPGDLNENTIRRLALTSGLVDIKVAALDHEWSALKLVHRKH